MANQSHTSRKYGYPHLTATQHTMSIPDGIKMGDFILGADSHTDIVNIALQIGNMAERALLAGDKEALNRIQEQLAQLVVELVIASENPSSNPSEPE